MKKVIFICLIALSTCQSRPDGTKAATPAPQPTPAPAKDQPAVSPPAPVVVSHTDNQTTQNASIAPVSAATATQPQAPTEGTVQPTPINIATPTTNATKPEIDANTTSDKKNPASKEETTINPSKEVRKPDTVTPQPTPGKTENATTPENKNAKTDTTTLKPDPTTKPTEAPKAADTPTLQARGFDGPSFIGGIILTLGLLAIGFMGFKYYKNQTERNYHTL